MKVTDFYNLDGLISADNWDSFREEICLRYGVRNSTHYIDNNEVNNLDYQDNNFDYKFNDCYFRDGPINDQVDTCYYGCSITTGIGVPVEKRWSALLDNHYSWKSNNFAIPGMSPEDCFYMFAQTTKLVSMKRAVFFLPDPNRQTIAEYRDNDEVEYFLLTSNFDHYNKNTTVYTTAEHMFRLPEFYFIDRARTAINLIKYIGNLNNIQVIITSWNKRVFKLLKFINEVDFVPVDYLGRDKRHPGMEFHRQVAEQFKKLI